MTIMYMTRLYVTQLAPSSTSYCVGILNKGYLQYNEFSTSLSKPYWSFLPRGIKTYSTHQDALLLQTSIQ